MIKTILKTIKIFFYSIQKARAATILARNGKYLEAQAMYKD